MHKVEALVVNKYWYLLKKKDKTSKEIYMYEDIVNTFVDDPPYYYCMNSKATGTAQKMTQGQDVGKHQPPTEKIDAVYCMLLDDKPLTVKQIAETTDMQAQCNPILTDILGMSKMGAPNVDTRTEVVQTGKIPETRRLVMKDETWLHHFEPELQSKQWKQQGPTPPKKPSNWHQLPRIRISTLEDETGQNIDIMFGSNYTSCGGGFAGNAYGAYGGQAYPPNSGPPPPPGGFQSAYNVNGQYGGGYGGYQMGLIPPPGGQHGMTGGYGGYGGPVPGFSCPAVQQMRNVYQGPPPQQLVQMPQSLTCESFNNHMLQQQRAMQLAFLEQQKQMKSIFQAAMKEEEEAAEEEDAEDTGISEDDRQRLKAIFVNECMRRLAVSGTFELTSGTVSGMSVYPEDDPVVKFASSEDGTGAQLSGKKWDPEEDCNYLRWAMKGLGTNEEAIIQVVSTRNNAQRQELKKMFKSATGRDLIEDLNNELSGNFRGSVLGCFVPPAVYDAWSVKEAIYGIGTDETSLIEILMTRTNEQLREMVAVYPDVASPNRKATSALIEKDIEDDTSGYFKNLLIAAAQGNRGEVSRDRLEEAVEEVEVEDMEKAKREANLLYKAGEDRWGTDEETFIRIFSRRDPYQLRATWDEYVKLTQRDIVNSVDRETSGSFKKGLRAIRGTIKCRPMFFAERLVQCMRGLGTNDDDLIRIIVSRAEIDMMQIKQCFLELTKQTLWKWIKDDCSGDYKALLQAIVGRD